MPFLSLSKLYVHLCLLPQLSAGCSVVLLFLYLDLILYLLGLIFPDVNRKSVFSLD